MSILKTISGTGQTSEMYSIDFNKDICLIGHSGSGDDPEGPLNVQRKKKMSYLSKGNELRNAFKSLVYDYMLHQSECSPNESGLKQAEIFRACGLDWGAKENATSSNQQYWIVALLRELESEGKILRDPDSKKWRIK